MREEYRQEIEANLERARDSIQAAKTLAQEKHHDIAASRAYYAAFYAATAALLAQGFEFSKHSVLRAIEELLRNDD